MAKSRSEAIEASKAGAQAGSDLAMQYKREEIERLREALTPKEPPEDVSVDELTLSVTWGEEVYQPVQFHTFRVGPITASAKVAEGQSIAGVYRQLWAELDRLGRAQFEEKLAGALERIKRAGKAAFDAKEQAR